MMYIVFAGDQYYPGGGWNDFQGSYSSLNEAKQAVDSLLEDKEFGRSCDWAHVVDLNDMNIVYRG